MNKERRERIQKIFDAVDDIRADLEAIFEEEEECMNNMPENLANSERYERAEAACSLLGEAKDGLESVQSQLEEAME